MIAKFTLEGDIRFWGTVLLSNMIIQIVLGFCGEIGTLGTIQCTSRASLLIIISYVRTILFLVVWVPQFPEVIFFFSD